MRVRAILLAAALALAPLSVRAADLVVWWQTDFYPQEDAPVAELIAAFEPGPTHEISLRSALP
jgi:hypothetical protein